MEINISNWTHKFQNRTGLDAKTNSELYKSNRVCSVLKVRTIIASASERAYTVLLEAQAFHFLSCRPWVTWEIFSWTWPFACSWPGWSSSFVSLKGRQLHIGIIYSYTSLQIKLWFNSFKENSRHSKFFARFLQELKENVFVLNLNILLTLILASW